MPIIDQVMGVWFKTLVVQNVCRNDILRVPHPIQGDPQSKFLGILPKLRDEHLQYTLPIMFRAYRLRNQMKLSNGHIIITNILSIHK